MIRKILGLGIGWLWLNVVFAQQPAQQFTVLEPAELMYRVQAVSPDLKAQRARIDARKFAERTVGRFADPQFSYDVAPKTLDSDVREGRLASLTQTLPWYGKRGLEKDIAQSNTQWAQYKLSDKELTLRRAALHAYADWYAAHAARNLNSVNLTIWEDFLETARSRYDYGNTARGDVLQAELELVRLKHHRIVYNSAIDTGAAALKQLLNLDDSATLAPPAPFAPLVGEINPVILRAALAEHPQLKMLTAEQQMAQQKTARAEKEFYPDVTVALRYNSIRVNRDQFLTLGAVLTLPLDTTKRQAEVDRWRSESQALGWELADRQTIVQKSFEQALVKFLESQKIVDLYGNELLPVALENVEIAKTDYVAGRGNFTALTNLEKQAYELELTYENVRADYYRALANLEYAAGVALIPTEEITP